ncbi:hypothetical protein [Oceanobacillus kimchii]|uniref:hypothetical protein n=1 Tax=Oceanobacillus kimchii TaxID=746691 RepID=UPI000348CC4E
MRPLISVALFISLILIVLKWRYKLFNALFAISIIRKIAVRLAMNFPGVQSKIFGEPSTSRYNY